MDPEVQEYFSSHEAVLIGKTVDLASNGDADQLRSAALDLKSWRDMREFVRGVATSLPRINDSLEDMRQRAESSP